MTTLNCSQKVRKLILANSTEDDMELPEYVWPGGYPVYYVDSDMEVLCANCATLEVIQEIGSPVTDYDIHYEGEAMICSECYGEIESAYGEVEEE